MDDATTLVVFMILLCSGMMMGSGRRRSTRDGEAIMVDIINIINVISLEKERTRTSI